MALSDSITAVEQAQAGYQTAQNKTSADTDLATAAHQKADQADQLVSQDKAAQASQGQVLAGALQTMIADAQALLGTLQPPATPPAPPA